jgi:hypothetical protein
MSKLFCARLRLVWSSASSARAARRSHALLAVPRVETPPVFPSRRNVVAQRRCACKQLCDARPTALFVRMRDFQVPR